MAIIFILLVSGNSVKAKTWRSSIFCLIKFAKSFLIIGDVAGDIETGNKIIESLEARHGDNDICSILCLQSGSSKEMIENTWKKIKAQRPIIALTKSDECNLSSMAMSKIAELKGKIGLVSGTRSIVDSLLFTNSDILAKYMKENF